MLICSARGPSCVPFDAFVNAAATGAIPRPFATTAAAAFDGAELVLVDADVDVEPPTVVAAAVVDPAVVVAVDVVGVEEFDGGGGGGG